MASDDLEAQARRARPVSIGDELYGISISELEARITALKAEIIRCEAFLTKKTQELSEAETLFSPKKS